MKQLFTSQYSTIFTKTQKERNEESSPIKFSVLYLRIGWINSSKYKTKTVKFIANETGGFYVTKGANKPQKSFTTEEQFCLKHLIHFAIF